MPRVGVTEQQILAAIEAVHARGVKVTRNSVRDELGTGSFGTLLPHIRAWKIKQSSSQELLAAPVPIPEEIQTEFAKVWSIAQILALAELAPQREALAIQAAGLKTVIEQAEDKNEEDMRELEIQMDSLKTQLSEANDKDKVTQTQLVKLSEEVGYLRAKLEASEAMMGERLAEKDARIELLAASLAAATTVKES